MALVDTQCLEESLLSCLREVDEVCFAYLHGSVLDSPCPRDVDVGVYLRKDDFERLTTGKVLQMDFAIPMEMRLEDICGRKMDLQVLNAAPLPFRFRVVSTGRLILDRDPDLRSDFEYLTRCEYFDFRPRREEYLRELTA